MKLSSFLQYLDALGLLDLIVKLKLRNSILLVIMCHEIGKNVYYEEGIPTKLFEAELRYLLKLRFTFLPLCEALEIIEEEPERPHRIAVLTFDDAYKGVYENALPIMLKHGMRGTIYPVAGFVERSVAHWAVQIGFILRNMKTPVKIKLESLDTSLYINDEYDKRIALKTLLNMLPRMDVDEINSVIQCLTQFLDRELLHEIQELHERTMMNKEQLKEMAELGFEIGGHGYWHVGLTNISRERVRQEIESSLNFVNAFMSSSVCKLRTFAYPYGLYDDNVIGVLKELGFHAAVTMKPIVNKANNLKLYEIGRLSPYRFGLMTLSSFKVQLMRVYT